MSLPTMREPGEETIGLYPGLVVSDGVHARQAGSITVGRTRLPVWAFIHDVVWAGWAAVEDYYDAEDEETFGRLAAAGFVHDLMQQRGEFGRLVLLLADVERCGHARRPWWATRKHRRRLAGQLRRCLTILEDLEVGHGRDAA